VQTNADKLLLWNNVMIGTLTLMGEFLPRDALQCYHMLSVRLSICLSVTLVDHDDIV